MLKGFLAVAAVTGYLFFVSSSAEIVGAYLKRARDMGISMKDYLSVIATPKKRS